MCYYKRKINDEGKRKFNNSLKDIDWNLHISNSDSIDNKYDTLMNTISREYNKYFPLVKCNTSRKKTPCKAWMTDSLVRCCTKKRKIIQNLHKKIRLGITKPGIKITEIN